MISFFPACQNATAPINQTTTATIDVGIIPQRDHYVRIYMSQEQLFIEIGVPQEVDHYLIGQWNRRKQTLPLLLRLLYPSRLVCALYKLLPKSLWGAAKLIEDMLPPTLYQWCWGHRLNSGVCHIYFRQSSKRHLALSILSHKRRHLEDNNCFNSDAQPEGLRKLIVG